MLTCHACMNRHLQKLIGDSSFFSASLRTPLITHPQRQTIRRSHIAGFTEKAFDRNDSQHARGPPSSSNRKQSSDLSPRKSSFRGSSNPIRSNRTEGQPNNRTAWLESRGVTPLHKRAKEGQLESNTQIEIRNQLTHLKDPLKLAAFVRKSLREDDFERTLEIVRAASKDVQCTVSWNHLIDWQLSKGKMKAAIKSYNEMKKRAQPPDAHTYTIIFSGCAEHPNSTDALGRVMSVYQSMLAENAPIKPNTIHMNAVLKMCARAQDMDALFGIAAQMPAKGVRAPNNLTYTIILNALRLYAVNDLRSGLTPMQKRHNGEKAILDARRIWEDITKRWRQGDIWIDEELVCSMGRILLLGGGRDHDDILSLIEQTMKIPRQIPRVGSPARILIEPGSQGRGQLGSGPASAENQSENAVENTTAPVDQFKVISEPKAMTKDPSAYARPGRNSLSLIMQAMQEVRLKDPATKYWGIFTEELRVEPDSENFHQFLRILRMARASTETVELVLRMPRAFLEAKTFRIAMSTCVRDRQNQNAFANSGKVLDLMQDVLTVPNVLVLQSYLEVAVSAVAHSEKISSVGKNELTKYTQGRQILRALHRLNPSVLNLRSLLAYGEPYEPTLALDSNHAEFVESVQQLTRRMIGAYDLLMSKGLVARETHPELIAERSKLASFVTRHRQSKRKLQQKRTINVGGGLANLKESREMDESVATDSGASPNLPKEQARSENEAERAKLKAVYDAAEEERRAAEIASKGYRDAHPRIF